MRVTIIRDGVYSDWNSQPGKCGAVERRQGDKVDYPRWYALSLIDSGYARETVEIVEMTAPEMVPFEGPTLSPTVKWEEPTTTEPAAVAEPDATQRAKVLAEAFNVDLNSIEGSGKGGRITAADVRKIVDAE